MVADQIHDALAQVRTLQEFIIERNTFKGYSGTARLIAGAAAVAGAVVLSLAPVPATPLAHLSGWGVVLGVALAANYAALVYWFLFNRDVRRNPLMLTPALDAVPALAVGAAVSLALIRNGQYDLLFGAWMCLYGLAQAAYRHSLPRGIYATGIFYLCCGAWCLVWPAVHFQQPWPMGLVFGAGEIAGGAILILDHRRTSAEKEPT